MRPANYCTRERINGSTVERGKPQRTDWHRLVTLVRIAGEVPVLVNGQKVVMKASWRPRMRCDEIHVEHRFGATMLVQSLGLSVSENVALVWRYDDIKRLGKSDDFRCTFKSPPDQPALNFIETYTVSAVRTLAVDVYNSSEADLTRAYYALLERHGIVGNIATHVFRATKCSKQIAKHKHEPQYRIGAIERKEYAINSLTTLLWQHRFKIGYQWGWDIDHTNKEAPNVLYLTLPTGTIAFHSPNMPRGRFRKELQIAASVPAEYVGRYGDLRAMRVFRFCDRIVAGEITDDRPYIEPKAMPE